MRDGESAIMMMAALFSSVDYPNLVTDLKTPLYGQFFRHHMFLILISPLAFMFNCCLVLLLAIFNTFFLCVSQNCPTHSKE